MYYISSQEDTEIGANVQVNSDSICSRPSTSAVIYQQGVHIYAALSIAQLTKNPLSLQLQRTEQDKKTQCHSKARSWSTYSSIPAATLWSQLSLDQMARVLVDSITQLQHIICAQSTGWVITRIILSTYFLRSLSGDYSQNDL